MHTSIMAGAKLAAMLLLIGVVIVCADVGATNNINYCDVSIVGAGAGGLYTAWRLATSSSRVSASRICVFEKENRVGGRIYSVRGPLSGVPELGNTVLDMGAQRYNPISEYLTSSVINTLRVATECVEPATPDCAPSPPPTYYLRNKYIDKDQAGDSDYWPYNLLESEQWGPGKANEAQPLPENFLFVAYPFLTDYLPNLTSSDPTIKWAAVNSALKKCKNTKISFAGNLLAGNLDARIAFNDFLSTEGWQAAIDAEWGGTTWPSQLNLFWALREVIPAIASLGVEYRIPESGYATWVEKLAQQFTSRGGKLFLNTELVQIESAGYNLAKLTLASGEIVFSQSVILNMPPHSVKQLSGDLTPFRSPASPDALIALNSVFNVHSTKIAIYYSTAWWATKLNITVAELYTTELLRDINYGPYTCDPLTSRCNGGWIFGTIVGDENSAFFRQASTDQSKTLSILTTTNQGRVLLSQIHTSLLTIHANLLAKAHVNPTTISPPTKAVLANWNIKTLGGWHSTQPSPFDPSYTLQLFQQPASNSRVFLVNEAYSPRNGWAEGSLIMAEKYLKNYQGLARPTWLDPTWYDAWITQNV